ncbi:MAG: WD40 repeat domain-containing protein [Isosphaeraceae bacterium]
MAHQAWRDDDVTAAVALLEGTRPGLRGWEWHYVRSLCRPELATLDGTNHAAVAASFDADGSRLATLSGFYKIQFWDAGTGAEVPGRQGRTFEGSTSSAATGSRIILPDPTGPAARIRNVDTWAELVTLKGHSSPISSAAFSRDGTRAVTASYDGTARVWDATTGAALHTLRTPSPSVVFQASFNPDGSAVATAGEDGLARIWDARTGKELRVLKGHTRSVNALAFSEDGSRVVTAGDDKTARVWDAGSGECLLTLRGHARRVLSASFSRDGTRVVTCERGPDRAGLGCKAAAASRSGSRRDRGRLVGEVSARTAPGW